MLKFEFSQHACIEKELKLIFHVSYPSSYNQHKRLVHGFISRWNNRYLHHSMTSVHEGRSQTAGQDEYWNVVPMTTADKQWLMKVH